MIYCKKVNGVWYEEQLCYMTYQNTDQELKTKLEATETNIVSHSQAAKIIVQIATLSTPDYDDIVHILTSSTTLNLLTLCITAHNDL